jgi:ribosomal protein L10
MGKTRENKQEYFDKLNALMEEYPSIFLVNVDVSVFA